MIRKVEKGSIDSLLTSDTIRIDLHRFEYWLIGDNISMYTHISLSIYIYLYVCICICSLINIYFIEIEKKSNYLIVHEVEWIHLMLYSVQVDCNHHLGMALNHRQGYRAIHPMTSNQPVNDPIMLPSESEKKLSYFRSIVWNTGNDFRRCVQRRSTESMPI